MYRKWNARMRHVYGHHSPSGSENCNLYYIIKCAKRYVHARLRGARISLCRMDDNKKQTGWRTPSAQVAMDPVDSKAVQTNSSAELVGLTCAISSDSLTIRPSCAARLGGGLCGARRKGGPFEGSAEFGGRDSRLDSMCTLCKSPLRYGTVSDASHAGRLPA